MRSLTDAYGKVINAHDPYPIILILITGIQFFLLVISFFSIMDTPGGGPDVWNFLVCWAFIIGFSLLVVPISKMVKEI